MSRHIRAALVGAGFLVALAALWATPRPAHASADWCWDDPVVIVGGRIVDIRVQLPLANLLTMRSTTLTVVVPRNVTGFVLVDDVSAFPMRTTVSATGSAWNGSGPLPITLQAMVESPVAFNIHLVATPVVDLTRLLQAPTSAYGRAGTPLSMLVALGR